MASLQPTRVIVVEESPGAAGSLTETLVRESRIEVVSSASSEVLALKSLRARRADVAVIDASHPRINAFLLTRVVMETCPLPVVIVAPNSSINELRTSTAGIDAGAVAVVARPTLDPRPDRTDSVQEFVRTLTAMAEVKVVRRWARHRTLNPDASTARSQTPPARRIRLVAVGTSTGGPPVLQEILSRLGKRFPVPILIVQHIAPNFVQALADWLTETTGFPVHVGRNGDLPEAGHAYLAPDAWQMGVDKAGRIVLSPEQTRSGICPSIAHLFGSVADNFGADAAGVLLSGMGRDGAEALRSMRDRGALTLVQDRASSAIFGMPGVAISLDAATHVLRPDEIAKMLITATTANAEIPDRSRATNLEVMP